MFAFFANMTFPRAVIVVSLTASAVLGYYVQQKTARLAEIHEELAKVPALVQDIQRLGIEVDQYQQLSQGATTGENFDFVTYVRDIAADDTVVDIGQVNVDPSVRSPAKDIEDRIYKITPVNKNRRYTRGRIGNYLYKLEADSRRVHVTSMRLTPVDRIRPGEIGNDQWTFEASITSRSRVSSGD